MDDLDENFDNVGFGREDGNADNAAREELLGQGKESYAAKEPA